MTKSVDQQKARAMLSLLGVVERAISADPSTGTGAQNLISARAAITAIARSRYEPALRVLRQVVDECKDEPCVFLAIQAIDLIVNGYPR